jgi:hypothetical protein
MKTITAPNGKQYEVEEGWREMSTAPDLTKSTFLFSDGQILSFEWSKYESTKPIAWRPIVPPKEVRWRAEMGCVYWFVDDDGETETDYDTRHVSDELRYRIGNYFRTREEAEASNKAKVMRDPESER